MTTPISDPNETASAPEASQAKSSVKISSCPKCQSDDIQRNTSWARLGLLLAVIVMIPVVYIIIMLVAMLFAWCAANAIPITGEQSLYITPVLGALISGWLLWGIWKFFAAFAKKVKCVTCGHQWTI